MFKFMNGSMAQGSPIVHTSMEKQVSSPVWNNVTKRRRFGTERNRSSSNYLGILSDRIDLDGMITWREFSSLMSLILLFLIFPQLLHKKKDVFVKLFFIPQLQTWKILCLGTQAWCKVGSPVHRFPLVQETVSEGMPRQILRPLFKIVSLHVSFPLLKLDVLCLLWKAS